MLYSSILLSVIAGASTVAARQAVSEIAKDIIPGAYIFEFKDGSVSFPCQSAAVGTMLVGFQCSALIGHND